MSGGSYDYASSSYSLDDVLSRIDELRRLVTDLHKHPYAAQAAKASVLLLNDIDAFSANVEERLTALRAVWHGLEWWVSCDWSERQFQEECENYDKGIIRK